MQNHIYNLRSRTVEMGKEVIMGKHPYKLRPKHSKISYTEVHEAVFDILSPTINLSPRKKSAKKIVLDLNALQVDLNPPPSSSGENPSSVELKTVVHPIDKDEFYSFTYQIKKPTITNNNNNNTCKSKAFDMPSLDAFSPPPSPTAKNNSIYNNTTIIENNETKESTNKNTEHDDKYTQTTAMTKQNNVNNCKKCKCSLKNKLRTRQPTKQQTEVWDAIIKDNDVNEQVLKGKKPRFRIIGMNPKKTKRSLNYRKSRCKINIHNILSEAYPNAEWCKEVASGVSCSSNNNKNNLNNQDSIVIDNLPSTSTPKTKKQHIKVLSDVVVTPSTDAQSNQLKKHKMDATNKKYQVDVFTHGNDFDYSSLLEVLDPDCEPVFHLSPRLGFPEWVQPTE